MDFFFLAILAGFAVASYGMIALCDRVKGGGQ